MTFSVYIVHNFQSQIRNLVIRRTRARNPATAGIFLLARDLPIMKYSLENIFSVKY
jgi:hypothetical protein